MFRYVGETSVLRGRKTEAESHSGVRSLYEGLGAISPEPENGLNNNEDVPYSGMEVVNGSERIE